MNPENRARRRTWLATTIIIAANLASVATIQVMRTHAMNDASKQRAEISRMLRECVK